MPCRDAPHPRVILLDMMMPRVSGWEFCRAQASDPALAAYPGRRPLGGAA
jgi:CheY-like chemotaxis protein